MQASPQSDSVSPEALELGYQPEATPVRGLLVFIILVVASVVIVHVLIWWIMNGIEAHNAGMESPRSVFRQDQTPPSPALQPSVGHDAMDYEDLAALRRREDETFAKLGWGVHPGAVDAEIPPEIIRRVAEEQRAPRGCAVGAANDYRPEVKLHRSRDDPAGDNHPGAHEGTP